MYLAETMYVFIVGEVSFARNLAPRECCADLLQRRGTGELLLGRQSHFIPSPAERSLGEMLPPA